MRLDRGQIEVVDEAVAEVLRKKEPWERLAIGFKLWESAREMLISHLSKTHPEWSLDRVKKETARRMSHGAV